MFMVLPNLALEKCFTSSVMIIIIFLFRKRINERSFPYAALGLWLVVALYLISPYGLKIMIHPVEDNMGKIGHLFNENEFEARINAENGIKYEDFMSLIQSRGSFKEAFEDIMFSTKVIISKKEDFVDFLAKLIENGFVEISLNYLENAVTLFPNDEQLISLIKKAQK